MSGIKLYVIDVETTGFLANLHEMTEIGIIRHSDRVQLCRNIKCENPQNASFDALAITNKTMADLLKGHNKEDVVIECDKFFNEDGLTPAHRCIIGHNIQFDRKFLHALWGSCSKEFPANLWLDTMALTKQFIKTAGLDDERKKMGLPKLKVNLHAACDILEVNKIADAHNSKVDSRNTYLLHKQLVDIRKVDYLPFIKTFIHSIAASTEESGLDPDLLDL